MQGHISRHRSGKVTRGGGAVLAGQYLYLPDGEQAKQEYIASWQREHQVLDPVDIVQGDEVLLPGADADTDDGRGAIHDPHFIPCSNLDDELDARDVLSGGMASIDTREPAVIGGGVSGQEEVFSEVKVGGSTLAGARQQIQGGRLGKRGTEEGGHTSLQGSSQQYHMTDGYQVWNWQSQQATGNFDEAIGSKVDSDIQGLQVIDTPASGGSRLLEYPTARQVNGGWNPGDLPAPPSYTDLFRKVKVVVVDDKDSSVQSGELVTNLDEVSSRSDLDKQSIKPDMGGEGESRLYVQSKAPDHTIVQESHITDSKPVVMPGVSLVAGGSVPEKPEKQDVREDLDLDPDYPSSESGRVELPEKPEDKAPSKWAYYSSKSPHAREPPVTKRKKKIKSALKSSGKKKLFSKVLQRKPKEKVISFNDDGLNSSVLSSVEQKRTGLSEANNRVSSLAYGQHRKDDSSDRSSHMNDPKRLRRTTVFNDTSSRSSFSNLDSTLPMRLPQHDHFLHRPGTRLPNKPRKPEAATEWRAVSRVTVSKSDSKDTVASAGAVYSDNSANQTGSIQASMEQEVTSPMNSPKSTKSVAVFQVLPDHHHSDVTNTAHSLHKVRGESVARQAVLQTVSTSADFQATPAHHLPISQPSPAVFQAVPKMSDVPNIDSPLMLQDQASPITTVPETFNKDQVTHQSPAVFQVPQKVDKQPSIQSSAAVFQAVQHEPKNTTKPSSAVFQATPYQSETNESNKTSSKTFTKTSNKNSSKSSSKTAVISPFRHKTKAASVVVLPPAEHSDVTSDGSCNKEHHDVQYLHSSSHTAVTGDTQIHRPSLQQPPADHLTSQQPPADHLTSPQQPPADHLTSPQQPPADHLTSPQQPPADHMASPLKATHHQEGPAETESLYHSINRISPRHQHTDHHGTDRTGRKVEIPQHPIEKHVELKKKVSVVDHATESSDEGIGCCGYILLVISGIIIFFTLPISLCLCIKVVQEYERAVIFRLGRLLSGGAKGPGLFFIIPCMDNYLKVDLRTVSFDVPPQEVLSKDSVTVAVDAVVYYRISNATISVTNVEDANRSTRLLAATTLRNVLGTKNLSEILSDRENISHMMQSSLDEATDPWGVKVERVEVKDVRLPVQLQRAMAAEAEAAREARAKVIAAEGEQKASRALKEAADIINESPSALQLRYLQTLNTISAEKNSTIVFPIPIDMMQGLMKK